MKWTAGHYIEKRRPKKEAWYKEVITKYPIDGKQKLGLALSGTNLSKYEKLRTTLNLSRVLCVERNYKTYNIMRDIQLAKKLYNLDLYPGELTDVLNFLNINDYSFIDLDLMTYWYNALQLPKNKKSIGYGIIPVFEELLPTLTPGKELLIMITSLSNCINLNNSTVFGVKTVDDFINGLTSICSKFDCTLDTLVYSYKETKGSHPMDTCAVYIKT